MTLEGLLKNAKRLISIWAGRRLGWQADTYVELAHVVAIGVICFLRMHISRLGLTTSRCRISGGMGTLGGTVHISFYLTVLHIVVAARIALYRCTKKCLASKRTIHTSHFDQPCIYIYKHTYPSTALIS